MGGINAVVLFLIYAILLYRIFVKMTNKWVKEYIGLCFLSDWQLFLFH